MGGDLTYDHDGSETVFTLTLEKALDRKSPDGKLPVTSYQLPAKPVET
jgi:hypothetical protein